MTTAQSFLDVTSPEFSFDSVEVAKARANSWYAQTPLGVLVLRYAEVQELLHDRRLIQNGKRHLAMQGVVDGPIYDWFVPMLLHLYGDDHTRLRRLVSNTFKPSLIEALVPFIRATAEQLTDQLDGVCDFVDVFGDKMTLAVMGRLVGVPAENRDRFGQWMADLGHVYDLAAGPEALARLESAVVQLCDYFDALITSRAADPRQDLVSALVQAQRDNEQISAEELRNLLMTLVFAGHGTTRSQLALAVSAFCEHPEQWALLREHPELAAQAANEVIRWIPSVPVVFRFAAADFEYKGLSIPAGTFVMLCSHSAGRDPQVVRDGERFDITAKRATGPLTFGAGPHYCLGAAIARAELTESLTVLTRRLGPPSVAGPVTWRSPIGIYGPWKLPVRFGVSRSRP